MLHKAWLAFVGLGSPLKFAQDQGGREPAGFLQEGITGSILQRVSHAAKLER